MMILEKK